MRCQSIQECWGRLLLVLTVATLWGVLLPLPARAQNYPSITQQPQSQSVLQSSNAVFTVVASGQDPLVYRWYRGSSLLTNGGRILGATSASLQITNVQGTDAGNYLVTVSNRHGMVTSAVATLTVLFPPSLVVQPAAQSVPVNSNVTFQVSGAGTPPLFYQWRKGETNLANTGNIAGANTTNLTLTTVQPLDSGAYSVILTNAFGAATSSVANLTVVGAAFTEVADLPGLWAGPLAWGDFNSDGRLDLVTGGLDGAGTPRTRVYLNGGNESFNEASNTGLPQLRFSSAAVADADKDGWLDVLLAGEGSPNTAGVFRGDGAGGFTNVVNFGPGSASAVDWGDFDGDGYLDVAVAGYLSYQQPAAVHRNEGQDFFANIGASLPALVFCSVQWTDYDDDGLADLMLSGLQLGTSAPFRKLYRSTGNTLVDSGLVLPTDGSVAWGDFDNDGDPDLLRSASTGNAIYRNDGSGNFTIITAGLPGSPVGQVNWGDFDNDGWLDVLVTGQVGNAFVTRLFRNNAGVSFTDTGLSLPGVDGPVRCADFDNDGDLDFALTGHPSPTAFGGILKIFRNDVIQPNPAPNAPTGLTTTVTNLSTLLVLSWNAAADTNQSAGHSYNLRIGTQPGANDVFDPVVEPTNGFRRIVGPGNCGGGTSRVFTNFPAGVYYWSVQAIDHCFIGSAMSAEASFVISKPTISDIPDQNLFPNITNAIAFLAAAVGTPVDTLTLSASAADNGLIPTNGFSFEGTGTNRTLRIAPARNQHGSTTITVTVTDTNGASATDSFVAQVRHTFENSGFNFPAAGAAVWGDYDNDGFPDLLLMGSPLRLYHNDTGGGFTQMSAGLPASLSGDAAWGDFDNDGWLDLALTGWTGSNSVTLLYHNTGSGTFTPVADSLPDSSGSVAWGDFDNDGDLDLLCGTDVYRNNTGGSFAPANTGLPGGAFTREAWGDFNRDGLLDLLMKAEGQTSVYRNNGNGTFSNLYAGMLPLGSGHPAWGDLDNDGWLDVAVIGSLTKVYRNNRDNTFSDIGAGLQPLDVAGLAWGDFDNDGWSDLVITGTTNYVSSSWIPALAYHNNGDGTFTDAPFEFYGGFGNIGWVDYDADGALDLMVSNPGDVPTLYRNATPKKNIPPAPPTGLAVQLLPNNDVRLTWQPATDAETTNAAALGHSLCVGTTPGGIQIVSPQADLDTGQRRLPQRGQASTTNSWLLRDLVPGTYFWSVQSVDQAFAGSAFSAEAGFSITNHRPAISLISTQTISHSLLSAPIAFLVSDVETPAAALIVTATSSDTNRIPLEEIYLGGSDSNRVVQLRPRTNQIGAVTITLTVADAAGATRDLSFVVNVTNLPPSITGLSNFTALVGAAIPPLPFVIDDPESDADELSLAVTWSNTNFLAATNFTFTGTGSNRFLQVTPPPGQKGISTIRVIVSDPLGAPATNAFALRVGEFQPVASGLPDVQQGAMDWGDFDNDGDLDLLICGRLSNASSITRIYRNNGDGTFTDIAAGLPALNGTTPPILSWADYDADGDLDFLIAGIGLTRVYRNNGDQIFTNAVTGLPNANAAAWADHDNDGDLDLVVGTTVAPAATPTRIYRNDGGTFTNMGVSLPMCSRIAVADYDLDGDVDFAFGGTFDKQALATQIVRNDGGGSFTNLNIGPGVSSGSLAWGDYDQDGRPDLLLTGINGNAFYTRLYHNDGGNSFTLVATNLPGIDAGTAVWGDYDNDGDLDIFLAGLAAGRDGSRIARIYRNDGGGTFADIAEPFTGTHWSAAAWGDFDGDGRLDMLASGTTNGLTAGSGTALYRNRAPAANTPPSVPTGLNVSAESFLSWNPATDSQTTNGPGLTYNVRIGTNAGGSQIMPPHANPLTGQRRVVRSGNVGAATAWPAKLPPGIYYWSVQVIDAGFAGSPFAPEASFAVIPHCDLSASGINSNGFTFYFTSMAGVIYVVEYTASLNSAAWVELERRFGTGSVEVVVDAGVLEAQRFYRVRALFAPGPSFKSPAWNGTGLELQFDTVPGARYLLEYKNHLDDPAWIELSRHDATGSSLTVTDPGAPGDSRFYRIKVE